MNNSTNLAIIGYGYMGSIYERAALDLGRKHQIESYYKYDLPELLRNLSLKAVVDISFPESSYDSQEDIWYFSTIDEMLTHRELGIDAAVVAVPTSMHFSVAKQLIGYDISLLIEKPVCSTAGRIKKLIDAAAGHDVCIMPGHVERYNPVTLDALETVQYKMLGEVTDYRFNRTSLKPERVTDNLIIDKLVHDIDLVQCLFGPFTLAGIDYRRERETVVECAVSTRHESGLSGKIFSSWLIPEKKRGMEIGFERGRFLGNFLEKTAHIDRYMEFQKDIAGYKNNQIKDQLGDFIAFKCRKIKTLVNIEDALQSAYIIDEIIREVNA